MTIYDHLDDALMVLYDGLTGRFGEPTITGTPPIQIARWLIRGEVVAQVTHDTRTGQCGLLHYDRRSSPVQVCHISPVAPEAAFAALQEITDETAT